MPKSRRRLITTLFLEIAIIAIVLNVATCDFEIEEDSTDLQCPNVPEDKSKGFYLSFDVEWAVTQAIKANLNDPGSYERDGVRAYSVKKRHDGSEYYSQLMVDFRAKNAFGGRVLNQAYLSMAEGGDGGYQVVEPVPFG